MNLSIDFKTNSGDQLRDVIENLFSRSKKGIVASAFVFDSGADMLVKYLNDNPALKKNFILYTGISLQNTTPTALKKLLAAKIQTRIYNQTNTFHPKVYHFTMSQGTHALIGSSNLSTNAFGQNIEACISVKIPPKHELKSQIDEFFQEIEADSIALTAGFIDEYEKKYKKQTEYDDYIKFPISDREIDEILLLKNWGEIDCSKSDKVKSLLTQGIPPSIVDGYNPKRKNVDLEKFSIRFITKNKGKYFQSFRLTGATINQNGAQLGRFRKFVLDWLNKEFKFDAEQSVNIFAQDIKNKTKKWETWKNKNEAMISQIKFNVAVNLKNKTIYLIKS